MRQRLLASLLIASPLLVLPASALAADEPPLRTLTVTGTAEVKAKPDIAMISSGVESEATTAAEALAKNNEAMTRIFAALKKAGVPDTDIQTSNFSVAPEYSTNERDPRRIIRYRVNNHVRVRVAAIAKLGAILDALVQVGSNRIEGVAFDISQPRPFLDEARKRAVKDARAKAELLAAAAGVKLGAPRQISEFGGVVSPGVMYRAQAMDASVPIAPGQETVAANVTIVFQIQ